MRRRGRDTRLESALVLERASERGQVGGKREREREGVSPVLNGQYKQHVCSDKVYISISICIAL